MSTSPSTGEQSQSLPESNGFQLSEEESVNEISISTSDDGRETSNFSHQEASYSYISTSSSPSSPASPSMQSKQSKPYQNVYPSIARSSQKYHRLYPSLKSNSDLDNCTDEETDAGYRRRPLHTDESRSPGMINRARPRSPSLSRKETEREKNTRKLPIELNNHAWRKFGFCICVGIVFAVIFAVCANQSPSPTDAPLVQWFLGNFTEFKLLFPEQSTKFWSILRAGAKPIIEQQDPKHPAVFIVAVPSDATATAECLVRQFSTLITKVFVASQPVEFTPDRVSIHTPQTIKHQIDDTLSGGLSKGSRVAVIHHLERLAGESAMMLHAFCDNDNAPYRRTVFILTLYFEELSNSVKETDDTVEERLQQLWGEQLGSNRLPPLLSRIANSIAFVRPESDDNLKQRNC